MHLGGHSRVRTKVDALNIHRVLQSTSGQFLNMYHYTNASSSIVRVIKSTRMSWSGHVTRMVERRDVYRVLVEKPEGKRPLGRPRRGWEDNIKMDVQDVGCVGGGVWSGSSWLRIGTGGGHL